MLPLGRLHVKHVRVFDMKRAAKRTTRPSILLQSELPVLRIFRYVCCWTTVRIYHSRFSGEISGQIELSWYLVSLILDVAVWTSLQHDCLLHKVNLICEYPSGYMCEITEPVVELRTMDSTAVRALEIHDSCSLFPIPELRRTKIHRNILCMSRAVT
jgi:hypothetical protein